MIKCGIDLGGTKIEGVVIDTDQNNQVLSRKRIPTEGDQGYDHVLNRIKSLVEELERDTGLELSTLGIGTPGSLDPKSELLKGSNSVHLNNQPVLKDLTSLLSREIRIANDANCFALAETHMGVIQNDAPSAKVVFGIIMGTGVGGGLVVNSQILNGANGIAGEWGHNFLHESGGQCYCGKYGCVETIISGPALEKFYLEKTGKSKKLYEIYTSREEDEHASQTINRLIKYFGIGVSTIINLLDPDAIILGGGVGNIDVLYSEGIDSIKKYVFNPDCSTKILKPKLGDSAGVFGAAFL